MALRKILFLDGGEARLRRVSKPVTEYNIRLSELLDDLYETLKKADGLGLAAPQVGILKRAAVVIDAETGKRYELINPVVVAADGEVAADEGCLSIPGLYEKTKRPERVKVRTNLRDGGVAEYEGAGMLARAFCHEIDHLDGVLFIDRVKEQKMSETAKNNARK
ncbi:MAG: peptide deformylase [Clostridiales bacterium]|jgi:peptide deformylase|nr:peptide deformylase [Clostridiales bacterium]